MVIFDTTTLLLLIVPTDKVRVVSRDGRHIVDAKERLDHLIATLAKERTKILIPTPSLSEALVNCGDATRVIVDRLTKSSAFRIEPFGTRAAEEAAIMYRDAMANGLGKRGGAEGDWQKIKVDRQIVAIGKVHGATTIYSNDRDIRALAPVAGMSIVGIEELPLPPPPTGPILAPIPLFDRMEDLSAPCEQPVG